MVARDGRGGLVDFGMEAGDRLDRVGRPVRP